MSNLNIFVQAVLFVAVTSILGCAGGPDETSDKNASAPEVKAALQEIETGSPREGVQARARLLSMGAPISRALERELKDRVEKGDDGPGLVCICRLLGAMGGKTAPAALACAARQQLLDPAVRLEAIRALGASGRGEGIGALVSCCDEEEPLSVRLAATSALGSFPASKPAFESLLKILAGDETTLRLAAARALLGFDQESLQPLFQLRLLDRDPAVRLVAITYAENHLNEDNRDILRVLAAHDRDLRVATAAARALREGE